MHKQYSKHLLLMFILCWLLILMGILTLGWTSTWKMLFVPTMSPPFADMRTVQGSLSSIQLGLNPQLANPGDPWGRPMNYPSVWSSAAKVLDLQNELNYLIFICIAISLFILCCFLLLRKQPSLLLFFACFSGSALLAVERGNNDIIVFVMLFFAACSHQMIGIVALLIAASLKVYPLLAAPAIITNLRTSIAMAIGIVFLVPYLWPELALIRQGTPVSVGLSYGSPSLAAIAKQLGYTIPSIALSFALVLFSLLISLRNGFRRALTSSAATIEEGRFFLVGSLVYAGTFLFSSNWDYRLIFLLFCIPLITKLDVRFSKYAIGMALLIAMNQLPMYAAFGKLGLGINVLAKIFLFVCLSAIAIFKFSESLSNFRLKFELQR